MKKSTHILIFLLAVNTLPKQTIGNSFSVCYIKSTYYNSLICWKNPSDPNDCGEHGVTITAKTMYVVPYCQFKGQCGHRKKCCNIDSYSMEIPVPEELFDTCNSTQCLKKSIHDLPKTENNFNVLQIFYECDSKTTLKNHKLATEITKFPRHKSTDARNDIRTTQLSSTTTVSVPKSTTKENSQGPRMQINSNSGEKISRSSISVQTDSISEQSKVTFPATESYTMENEIETITVDHNTEENTPVDSFSHSPYFDEDINKMDEIPTKNIIPKTTSPGSDSTDKKLLIAGSVTIPLLLLLVLFVVLLVKRKRRRARSDEKADETIKAVAYHSVHFGEGDFYSEVHGINKHRVASQDTDYNVLNLRSRMFPSEPNYGFNSATPINPDPFYSEIENDQDNAQGNIYAHVGQSFNVKSNFTGNMYSSVQVPADDITHDEHAGNSRKEAYSHIITKQRVVFPTEETHSEYSQVI